MVDGRGNVYVNGAGFNPVAGESFQPGPVFMAGADGSVRQLADDITFPNGMAVTGDNSALIVADSYRHNLVAFDISADGGLSGRWARTDHATHRGRRMAGMTESQMVAPGSGRVLATEVEVPGAGWP